MKKGLDLFITKTIVDIISHNMLAVMRPSASPHNKHS